MTAAQKHPAVSQVERDLLVQMFTAFDALRKMGWREAAYAPKNTLLELIEAGSAGVFWGTRDEHGFWVFGGGDAWPSRAILFRLPPS